MGDGGWGRVVGKETVLNTAEIGIIGGTGLGDALLNEAGGQPIAVDTPFGKPSGDLLLTTWGGKRIAFIARHGAGHVFNPSNVPYRANIWAMKQLGVECILASGATGSLQEDVHPGQLVVCDQVIDKTFRRAGTFFDEGLVAHVEFAEPFCPHLRKALIQAGQQVDTKVHPNGTYVCMEGPQFSTRAESRMHRQWGADLIGMTCMPEAKLAREAQICYALLALPTDYDSWRPHDSDQEPDELLKEILGNLNKATDNAIALVRHTVSHIDPNRRCRCRSALKLAVWSHKDAVDPHARERLALLLSEPT